MVTQNGHRWQKCSLAVGRVLQLFLVRELDYGGYNAYEVFYSSGDKRIATRVHSDCAEVDDVKPCQVRIAV